MAFIGRTSTSTAQDPVQSLHKQMRRAEERLPQGFYIARWYWDIESGGTDLDERSRTERCMPYDNATAKIVQRLAEQVDRHRPLAAEFEPIHH